MSERSTDMATLSEHRGKQHIARPNRRLESNRKEQGISTPPSGLVTSHVGRWGPTVSTAYVAGTFRAGKTPQLLRGV